MKDSSELVKEAENNVLDELFQASRGPVVIGLQCYDRNGLRFNGGYLN